jgi:hypothetical protein
MVWCTSAPSMGEYAQPSHGAPCSMSPGTSSMGSDPSSLGSTMSDPRKVGCWGGCVLLVYNRTRSNPIKQHPHRCVPRRSRANRCPAPVRPCAGLPVNRGGRGWAQISWPPPCVLTAVSVQYIVILPAVAIPNRLLSGGNCLQCGHMRGKTRKFIFVSNTGHGSCCATTGRRHPPKGTCGSHAKNHYPQPLL